MFPFPWKYGVCASMAEEEIFLPITPRALSFQINLMLLDQSIYRGSVQLCFPVDVP